jgi:hypothetical protein
MPQIIIDVMQVGQSNNSNKYYYYYYYVKDEVVSVIIKQYPVKNRGPAKV